MELINPPATASFCRPPPSDMDTAYAASRPPTLTRPLAIPTSARRADGHTRKHAGRWKNANSHAPRNPRRGVVPWVGYTRESSENRTPSVSFLRVILPVHASLRVLTEATWNFLGLQAAPPRQGRVPAHPRERLLRMRRWLCGRGHARVHARQGTPRRGPTRRLRHVAALSMAMIDGTWTCPGARVAPAADWSILRDIRQHSKRI